MILVKDVKIEGFRSLRSAKLTSLSNLTALAGLNNSGKSNILRALNAFFNDETDPGQPVNVDADFYRPDLRRKKRKRIRISVTFDLPTNFNFRKGLEGSKALVGAGAFTVTKEWSREQRLPTFFLNDTLLDLDKSQRIAQFLQLIKYRYVPNRVLPTELIRDEHQNLRDVLTRRLAKQSKGDVKAFDEIKNISARMIESLTKRFEEACPGQGKVSLATPASWNELAFAFGYKLTQGGIEMTDAEQGSGIQSLLMLETLYLIDRDYFQQFGWRQAALWGLEEPESSLHTALEARVAAYLSSIATNPNSRLQVVCTTHSDLMVQYSGSTLVVDARDGETTLTPTSDARDALQRLSGEGVARWVHPILLWPLDPIVIVEGKFDQEFMEEACRLIKPKRQIHFVDLPELDPDAGGGGIERMRGYIKESAAAIRSRRPDAPVIAILDWDAASKLDQFEKLVNAPGIYKALAWPATDVNPQAGKTLRGAERYHCDRVLDLAIERGAPIARKTKGPKKGEYVVDPEEYKQVKPILAQITREGLRPDDLVHADSFVRKVLQEAGAI